MVKAVLLCFMITCFNPISYTQNAPVHYRDFIFSNVTMKKNLSYASTIPAGIKPKRYRLDLYQPAEDTSTSRPLIIWMHGGGFKFGSKKAKGIRIWSSNFARRGYVCAAVNYRLSKRNPLKNFNALVQACYDAVQDVTVAIEFMKRNAVEYRIDTNCIILAGNSAGGIIALQTAYSNNSQLASLLTNTDSVIHTRSTNRHNISAVINFWGALLDSSWLRNALVPIVSVHARKDRIVPYIQSESLYGSFIIHQKADSLNIPNRLKTYDRYGHELQKHFIPILRSGATKRRWKEAGQFAADFIFAEVIN
jgi:acetyl esterase/lipase